jgi:drug/metabolite transporter (DMT)-like permease
MRQIMRRMPTRLWYFVAVALLIGAAVVLVPGGPPGHAAAPTFVIAAQLVGLIAYAVQRTRSRASGRGRAIAYFAVWMTFVTLGGILLILVGDTAGFGWLRWAVAVAAVALTLASAWVLEGQGATRPPASEITR